MGTLLDNVNDYIIWYAKNKESVKYRQLYTTRTEKSLRQGYTWIEYPNGERRRLSGDELNGVVKVPEGRRFITAPLMSQSGGEKTAFAVELEGKTYYPSANTHWKTNEEGMKRLIAANRIMGVKNTLTYVRYADDFPVVSLSNFWEDTQESTFAVDKKYVVQTATKVIQRCLLMTTDPGDLVLDITCGSGTTAYVAEQWGRRWITCDTSRVAITLAKQRLMTATFDYYKLAHEEQGVGSGFVYKTVPHITLKSIANNEPPAQEILYDQPEIDKTKVRITGPIYRGSVACTGGEAAG